MADNSDEVDLELVKSQAFCCSVKLWIRQFRPEGPMTNPRQFDPKNVSRLPYFRFLNSKAVYDLRRSIMFSSSFVDNSSTMLFVQTESP